MSTDAAPQSRYEAMVKDYVDSVVARAPRFSKATLAKIAILLGPPIFTHPDTSGGSSTGGGGGGTGPGRG